MSEISDLIQTTIQSRVGAMADNILQNNLLISRYLERCRIERKLWEALPWYKKLPGRLRAFRSEWATRIHFAVLAIQGVDLIQSKDID